MNTDAKRCSFVKPNGSTCGAFAIKGSDLCFHHHPNFDSARRDARHAGGVNRHKKFKYHPDTFTSLVPLIAGAEALPVMVIPLLDAFLKVRDGHMDTRTANTLAYLASTLAQTRTHGYRLGSSTPEPDEGSPLWPTLLSMVNSPVEFKKFMDLLKERDRASSTPPPEDSNSPPPQSNE